MDRIEQAFNRVPRSNFLPAAMQEQARQNRALPIGFGQTNSQPYTVECMLRWLDPAPGQKILDVGSGSGWTSALLSVIVGEKGTVYAVEKIPELVGFGRENCQRLGLTNVIFFEAGKVLGLPQHAPYDRILVSASAREVPSELLEQLKPFGRLVVPVRNDILEITKTTGEIETITHSGFVFVPLIS